MARTHEEELIWYRFYQLERVEKGLQAAMSSLYVVPHASQEAHARDEALRAALAAAQKLLTERQEHNNAEHDALQARLYPEDYAAHQVT